MKKLLLLIFIVASFSVRLCADGGKSETQRVWLLGSNSVYENISGNTKKANLLNVDLHLHGGLNLDHIGSDTKGRFHMREARLSIQGKLTDWLSYRYRQKLNESNSSKGNMDHLPSSLDVLGIGVKFSDKLSVFVGKQAAAYGGIEYDLNPIQVYDYSESLLSLHGFMTGLTVNYKPVENQELLFQIVNSRMKDNINEEYGVGFEDPALPFMYSVNWNAKLSKVYSTRWSASLISQAKGKQAYYLSFGNILNFGKINMNLDLNFHFKDIDYGGSITSITGGVDDHAALDTRYQSIVYHLNYRINPLWNVFGKGIFDIASVHKASENIGKGTYKTTWGYQTGVEYYPIGQNNLHFFFTYTGKSHKYKTKAKEYEVNDNTDNNIKLGFIYVLPVF